MVRPELPMISARRAEIRTSPQIDPGRPWIGQPGCGRGELLKRASLPLLGQRQGGGGGWSCPVRNSNKEKKDASVGWLFS